MWPGTRRGAVLEANGWPVLSIVVGIFEQFKSEGRESHINSRDSSFSRTFYARLHRVKKARAWRSIVMLNQAGEQRGAVDSLHCL